jgi:hypothetical protein
MCQRELCFLSCYAHMTLPPFKFITSFHRAAADRDFSRRNKKIKTQRLPNRGWLRWQWLLALLKWRNFDRDLSFIRMTHWNRRGELLESEGTQDNKLNISNFSSKEQWRGEADCWKSGSHNSSWVMVVHSRVIFFLTILQIYPCNNAKYINKYNWDMMSGAHWKILVDFRTILYTILQQ